MQTARGPTPLPPENDVRADNVRTLRSPLRSTPGESAGIQVQEEELSSATAQRMFRMRCDCGRSWFELELKVLVRCPACARLSRVHMT
jgi:hypothetical protein